MPVNWDLLEGLDDVLDDQPLPPRVFRERKPFGPASVGDVRDEVSERGNATAASRKAFAIEFQTWLDAYEPQLKASRAASGSQQTQSATALAAGDAQGLAAGSSTSSSSRPAQPSSASPPEQVSEAFQHTASEEHQKPDTNPREK
jgi:hypothetical protein